MEIYENKLQPKQKNTPILTDYMFTKRESTKHRQTLQAQRHNLKHQLGKIYDGQQD
jgi:hypothetical protein